MQFRSQYYCMHNLSKTKSTKCANCAKIASKNTLYVRRNVFLFVTSFVCWCNFTTNIYHALDILFPSNHNIHKSSYGLCFWPSNPLIDIFYWSLSIKGSEVQKHRPHKLLWMLWFDGKNISNSAPITICNCICNVVKSHKR